MVAVPKLMTGAYAALGALVFAPTVVSVPVSMQMIGLSTVIIVIASFNAAERERERKRGKDLAPRDTIGREQAWRFPLVASAALFGMFLAFKFLPKEWVSFLLTLYAIGFGALAMATVISPHIARIPGVPEFAKKEYGPKDFLTVSMCDLVGLLFSVPVAVWYYNRRSWIPNNVLAVSLALSAVDALALGDFVSGVVMLSGLFVYDVFWVFFSKKVFGDNVMVSVAKQFEGPIKLIFPRFLGADAKDMSMLGLGDIVIPGLFVALTLRFDTRKLPLDASMSQAECPYFWSTAVAYVLGLVATVIALNVFKAAQPALLYLVPFCLAAPIGQSLIRGEFKALVTYAEEEPKKKDSDADAADVDADTTSKKDD